MRMDELRERIAETINNYGADNGHIGWLGRHTSTYLDCADQIIALIPKPTVKVPCGKCGGKGWWCKENTKQCDFGRNKDEHWCNNSCDKRFTCTCKDGMADREIEWEKPLPECGPHSAKLHTTLELPDLADPDVAMAYCELHENMRLDHWADEEIPNNKGTLRVKA
jgi:hypothetical protein